MTEPTIPSWSAMKKYYKETRSALFPLQDSIQKRDPRIEEARYWAADKIEDPELRTEATRDAYDTKQENPLYANRLHSLGDLNHVPEPQPERKDIPLNRADFVNNQHDEALHLGNILDNDNLREYLANGDTRRPVDPKVVDQILGMLHNYYYKNMEVAEQGSAKTADALDTTDYYTGAYDQMARIRPGRR